RVPVLQPDSDADRRRERAAAARAERAAEAGSATARGGAAGRARHRRLRGPISGGALRRRAAARRDRARGRARAGRRARGRADRQPRHRHGRTRARAARADLPAAGRDAADGDARARGDRQGRPSAADQRRTDRGRNSVTRLLARASARFYLRHPWQLALAIAGIGLGVAVFVGVELANDSARRAFDVSASTLRGAATHRLLPVGGELDERVYAELVRERGIELAAPALELDVIVHGRRVPLLGIDPLEEVTLRPFAGLVPAGAADIGRLIAEPGTVLLPRTLADALAIGPGDPIELGVE